MFLIPNVFQYISDHWRGSHSLAIAFWINFILFRALIFVSQANFVSGESRDFGELNGRIFVAIVLAHGFILIWQVVGVLRSAENYIQNTGFMAPYWGVLVSSIIAFLLTTAYILDAFQVTMVLPNDIIFADQMDMERANKYHISYSDDPSTLVLSGDIELGITRSLATFFSTDPTIRKLILQSEGGNVYEARGVSRLVRVNKIDTHIDHRCVSACTIIFVSGNHRTMRDGSRLGFHRYRMDTNVFVPNVEADKEQRRDQLIFAQSGVSEWFRRRMFDSSADKMWYPSQSDLLRARVVHGITSKQIEP